MKKFRIRRLDDLNWVLEVFVSPEHPIHKTGLHKGKPTKGRWKIEGYYARLEHMVPCLLELDLDGQFENTEEILTAIAKAKTEILKSLNQLILPEH